ncbi:MAG: hypothetical protein AAGB19_01550 [Cyanobacteria bacterium P01_F01_bin.3]
MSEQLSLLTLEPESATAPAPTAHRCHAKGCSKVVPEKMLMCRKHWAMVPKELQRAVWRHYRHGQEVDKNPSSEYLAAALAAINAVAVAEGRLPKTLPEQPKSLPLKASTGCQQAGPKLGDLVEVVLDVTPWGSGLKEDSSPARQFTAGDVVTIAPMQWEKSGEPCTTTTALAGSVMGYNAVDMVLVNLGVPSNPYICSEERLQKYAGVISLWRLRSDLSPPWWYVGHMATEPSAPKWPDAVWFPSNYNPNTQKFSDDRPT